MLKDTSRIDLCEICEYSKEIGAEISLSVCGVDYYRVECKKGNCDAGNGFIKAKTPKHFPKKVDLPKEPITEAEIRKVFENLTPLAPGDFIEVPVEEVKESIEAIERLKKKRGRPKRS